MKRSSAFLGIALTILAAGPARAACLNKFLNHTEEGRQVVTLLTGKLTFAEAQTLAVAIAEKKAAPLTWVDDSGKEIAQQTGPLKVIRPMPVGCDGKTSGVVLIVTFPIASAPSGGMMIKLDGTTSVQFVENTEGGGGGGGGGAGGAGPYAVLPAGASPPEELTRFAPQYPPTARKVGAEGAVVLKGIIRRDGTIDTIEIVKDRGYGLGDAAKKALMRWKFKPAILKGEPIEVFHTVTINFKLQ